jgi:hypothetical protein
MEVGMKAIRIMLVVLLAAIVPTSVAAAGSEAAGARVVIDMQIYPQGKFVLTPMRFGTLKPDSGTIKSTWLDVTGRSVLRDGQKATIYVGAITTLTGKLGTLTIRDRIEWVDLARDANGDGENDGLGTGTWTVVRGTGQYAGIVGKGRLGHIGLGSPWYARYEGFVNRAKP